MTTPGDIIGTLLPSITGNQAWDRLLRSGILAATVALTTVIVTWLNAHGFHDPNLYLIVGIALISAMGAAATVVWGWISGKHTEAAAAEILKEGVAAGIAHAEDPNVQTVPVGAVTKPVAAAIVASYTVKT